MAISRISSATNNGTTITIGTHAANDLIILFGYRDNNNSGPTLPSGWYGVFSGGGNSTGMTIGWKQATTASETSGTWTNATTLHAIVYRPGTDKIIIPKYYSGASASSVSVQVAAQPSGSFESNSDDLWLVAFIAQRNSSNSLETATWTGLSNVTSSTDGSTWQAVVNDSNSTRSTAWTSTTATVTNSASWQTRLLGLQEVPKQSASSGGGFRPVNIRGGADQ